MEQVELERRLAQSPLLAGVSLPAEQARVQSFPAGHILSDRPGGVPSVGLILSGRVEVYSVALDGKDVQLSTLPAGECFGVCNLLAGAELETVLRCGEETEVLYIPKPLLLACMERDAGLSLRYAELCNQKLQEPAMSARSLIANSGVTLVCTTDDPADSLEWHQQLAQDSSFPVKVLPAWRPDAAMGLERPEYLDYLQRLGQAAGVEIRTYGDLKKALLSRMAFFDKMGCRASDHALTVAVCQPASEEELERVFQKRLEGEPLTQEELAAFQTGFLRLVAGEYKRLGWVMQLHYGCRRNNNTRMFHKLGRDTGYDAVLQGTPSLEVAAFLDLLASQDALPRMVLYSLNPNDDEGLNSVIGCFQDGTPLGRIQQGSAWWFNDHKAGMVKQLTAFANGGLLGNFIGMLTDSRSFLSYPRHEYFRRILCELLGAWVENGEYPADWKALEKMVRGVCYNNAVEFFGFPLEKA